MPVVIGIDPGISGAYAIWQGNRGESGQWAAKLIPTILLPNGKDDIDIPLLASTLKQYAPIDLAVVERVNAHPDQGVVSMFTFGRVYGEVLGMLRTLGIPLEQPTPKTWRKLVLAGFGDKTKVADTKAAPVAYVQTRFPQISLLSSARARVPNHNMADAICQCEYGRRLLLG